MRAELAGRLRGGDAAQALFALGLAASGLAAQPGLRGVLDDLPQHRDGLR